MKVQKIVSDAQTFMTTLQIAAKKNTSKENEAIVGLRTSLQKDKEALVQVHTDQKTENTEFQTSLYSKIDKLREDLTVESGIMEELAAKTTKVQVLAAKLAQENKEIKELKSEQVFIKSVGDVNALLSNILDAHNPILSISIRRHLADKFRPALAMLNQIEGVSKSSDLPKQGGESSKETSTSSKD